MSNVLQLVEMIDDGDVKAIVTDYLDEDLISFAANNQITGFDEPSIKFLGR